MPLSMTCTNASILLRCPDIEFDLHRRLLGLIQEAGQHSQRPLLPICASRIKALTFDCCLNRKNGLVAQCMGVEIRKPLCRKLKGLCLQDRLRCRPEALMPNIFDPLPNLVARRKNVLLRLEFGMVSEVQDERLSAAEANEALKARTTHSAPNCWSGSSPERCYLEFADRVRGVLPHRALLETV